MIPLPLALIMLAGCGGPEDEPASPGASQSAPASASASPTATPKTTPTPTPTGADPIRTTGDYEADLAAIGVVPDDATAYGEFMEENLCSDDDPTDINSRFNMTVRVNMLPGSVPDSGGGVETLRLAVAYFCPERARALEESIETNGFTTTAP